jgi:hypothetical protein
LYQENPYRFVCSHFEYICCGSPLITRAPTIFSAIL